MSIEDYIKKAEDGSVKAQCTLGMFYYNGDYGVERDYSRAFEWFSKAAQQNNAFALYRLGICYLHGKGVQFDYVKAKECLQKAVDNGSEDAEYLLESLENRSKVSWDLSEDPYKYAKKKHQEIKDGNGIGKKINLYREIKINTMLVLIGVVFSLFVIVLFVILFGDRWNPDVYERRLMYVSVGSLFFSVAVLIIGRYSSKIVYKIYGKLRKRRFF